MQKVTAMMRLSSMTKCNICDLLHLFVAWDGGMFKHCLNTSTQFEALRQIHLWVGPNEKWRGWSISYKIVKFESSHGHFKKTPNAMSNWFKKVPFLLWFVPTVLKWGTRNCLSPSATLPCDTESQESENRGKLRCSILFTALCRQICCSVAKQTLHNRAVEFEQLIFSETSLWCSFSTLFLSQKSCWSTDGSDPLESFCWADSMNSWKNIAESKHKESMDSTCVIKNQSAWSVFICVELFKGEGDIEASVPCDTELTLATELCLFQHNFFKFPLIYKLNFLTGVFFAIGSPEIQFNFCSTVCSNFWVFHCTVWTFWKPFSLRRSALFFWTWWDDMEIGQTSKVNNFHLLMIKIIQKSPHTVIVKNETKWQTKLICNEWNTLCCMTFSACDASAKHKRVMNKKSFFDQILCAKLGQSCFSTWLSNLLTSEFCC